MVMDAAVADDDDADDVAASSFKEKRFFSRGSEKGRKINIKDGFRNLFTKE